MAKVGDKYIIEIDSVMNNENGTLYGVKGFRSLVFDEEGLNRLEKLVLAEVDPKDLIGCKIITKHPKDGRDYHGIIVEAYERETEERYKVLMEDYTLWFPRFDSIAETWWVIDAPKADLDKLWEGIDEGVCSKG